MRISVYGGGSWGTALAHVLATAGHDVFLVLRDQDLADQINTLHENTRYLPGLKMQAGICACTDPERLADAELWVMAVPTQAQRKSLRDAARLLRPRTLLVNASKGIELTTRKLLSQVVREALLDPPDFASRYAVLSGPSFAREVMEGKPTAVVLGCADEQIGAYLRDIFATQYFRAYSSPDVRGVELGGAVKNVMAIAAGVCDGLNFGQNARAALITRGLAEITRLGTSLGANPATFMGLSGLGDLMLTSTGDLSRNRQVGLRLSRGEKIEAITDSMRMVAEGVKTTEAVYLLAREQNVEMPITAAMREIIQGRLSPMEGVINLMSRTQKEEFTGLS